MTKAERKRRKQELEDLAFMRCMSVFSDVGKRAAEMSQRTGLSLDFCSGVLAHRLQRSMAA